MRRDDSERELFNARLHILDTFNGPELIPAEEINVHIDTLFEMRNLRVEMAAVQEVIDAA